MAVIKPFRAVRYNPERFDDMRVVVSQPYDRVRHGLQDRYYDLSPYNIVRIIKGKEEAGDRSGGSNVYTRAKAYYEQWRKDGVLIREAQPALYVYEQTFTVGGEPYTRLGMIAALELAGFDEGIVLPHERTHGGPKEDRLRLLNTLAVHTGQIFILYPDEENRINNLLRLAVRDRAPDIDVAELYEDTVKQRVWVVGEPEHIEAIRAEMLPKRGLIIADGHHRYETGLAYRDAQRAAHPGAPPGAAFNYIQATLVSMDDPGLVVLPTHREIYNFTAAAPADVLARAAAHFAVAPAAGLSACLDIVNQDPLGLAFGFYGGKEVGFHVLTLKDAALVDALIPGDAHSRAWKSLSVSVLHKVLLEQIVELPAAGIEEQTMVRYHREAQLPVDNVDAGLGSFVFFLKATPVEHIKACTAHGERMPQKSTDFYPKIISGLTMMPAGTEEDF
ncbi:MAG: DUF1015 domain-containing protein [Anaerolineae bacterium]|nr:DUF1015 domain-containing protein [Anaerolineae bacterium]